MLVAFQQFVALLSGGFWTGWGEQVAGLEGCSSIGRALVSKTSGCGFKSLRPCFVVMAGRHGILCRAVGYFALADRETVRGGCRHRPFRECAARDFAFDSDVATLKGS